jgi:hypothetical protein
MMVAPLIENQNGVKIDADWEEENEDTLLWRFKYIWL